MNYKKYLKSKHWKIRRKIQLSIQSSCKECGSKRNLQVHHKTYVNMYNEKDEDLETLCNICHRSEHKKPTSRKKIKKKELYLDRKFDLNTINNNPVTVYFDENVTSCISYC